ncbi:MAG: monovalent cation/H+ antiporter complex subunit F [Bradymonadaceae bacterium]
MNLYLIGMALFLLANFAFGSIRILRGPTRADRMMAAQLFGSTMVAIILLLAAAVDLPELVDVALVFTLLAAVAVVAFVQRSGHPELYREESAREASHD